MDHKELLKRVDHTLLTPTAAWDQIQKLCDEGLTFGTASICIPPRYVSRAAGYVGQRLKICTVVGFPNGYNTPEVKVFETEDAIRNGADEIDMVMDLGLAKAGDWEGVLAEIRAVKASCSGHILKVIVEACQLTQEEKIAACRIVSISGADFINKILPDIPVLALTATATPEVVKDIQRQLAFREENAFRMSFERKNLAYIVRHTEDKFGELIHILNSTKGSAIVYTRSRRNTRETTEKLQAAGMSATFYHAGLNDAEKDLRQHQWQEDKIRIMVATNAFGMGIDKPDVRLVIHLDLPDSIEAYFQEAGRAGRDGAQAYAVLLYQRHDRTRLMKRIPDTFPDKDAIREVYEHICYYYQMAMGDGYNVTREFDLDEFCRNFKHFPVQTDSALHLLERAGYIEYTEEQDNASRIHFLLRRDELYRIHELEAEQEQLIQWVLRSYGGVFSDYVFIDERRIATLSGLTTDQVYHGLLALGRARILHYIPRKKTPYITFSCKRIEKERIVFPSSVYDERKKNFKERIEAMLYYAEEADFCRSKVLLHYFGEKDAQPCEQCDVCRIRKSHPHADATDEQIIALILETLKDGQKHNLSEMTFPGISREKTAQLLHQMIEEETVRIQNGVLFLPRP